MHNLIPSYIYERYQSGDHQGCLRAVTLFMDLSGFTAMTQALMQEGKAGAERLAGIINQIYDPIITAIYDHGGFVTGFAGDALTVVFPAYDAPTALIACQTALAIGRVFMDPEKQLPVVNDFGLAIKQGLSAGEVEWGIVGTATHKSYFFRGEAIDGCAEAEHRARAGDIVLDRSLQLLLPTNVPVSDVIDEHFARFTGCGPAAADQTMRAVTGKCLLEMPAHIVDQFFGREVWQTSVQGEFRDVATLFVSIQGTPELKTLNAFIAQAMHITNRYEGFFAEIDFGDNGGLFVVYFGAPIAHENDVERALRFSLDLQNEAAHIDLTWRAGLTLGTVYAGYVGIPLRDKYTCMGNIVNFAARLMMRAPWQEVWVSREVALHPSFDFVSLGQLALKGFARPVATYRFDNITPAERVFDQKMVGRESELRRLVEFAQPLLAGHRAGVIIIYGTVGIGKSHLAYALVQKLGALVRRMTGQSDVILRQPFNPFTYMLRGYFGQSAEQSEAQNKANFEHRFHDLLAALEPMAGTQKLHDELLRARSPLGALLGLFWPGSRYEQLDGQGRYQSTMSALTTFFQAECRRQPIVLELEDWHLSDDSSRDVITLLTKQVSASPVLIVITSRNQDDDEPLSYTFAADIPTLEIELERLQPLSVRTLAEEILGMEIDDKLHHFLVERTDANPYFVQQIVYHLQRNNDLQIVTRSGYRLATLPDTTAELPATLNTVLVARLDRLPYDVKEVVQVASVLGHTFAVRLLSRMLGRDASSLLALAEQERIWTRSNALEYVFKHLLMREAAYGMQLRQRLSELHYLAGVTAELLYAAQLPAHYGTLAYHFECAFLYGRVEAQEKATHYLYQAGLRALDSFELNLAIDYFSRALTQTDPDQAKQYQLLLAREKAYDIQGDRRPQQQDLDRLTDLTDCLSPTEQMTVALRRANFGEQVGDFVATIEAARSVIEMVQTPATAVLVAKATRQWGYALWRQGNFREAKVQLDRSYQLASEVGNKNEAARCLNGLGNVAQAQFLFAEAGDYYEQSLTIKREIGDHYGVAISLSNVGVALRNQGNYGRARTCHEQSLALCRETDYRHMEGINLNNLGIIALKEGNYASARSYCEHSLRIRREVADPWGIALSLNELGTVTLHQAEYALSQAYYEQAAAIHQELNLEHYLTEDWAGLARLKLAQGEDAGALDYSRKVAAYLVGNPRFEGAINPIQGFFFTWFVLDALGCLIEAENVLTLAAQFMQAYLDNTKEPELQAMYLNQPFHQRLWAAWHDAAT